MLVGMSAMHDSHCDDTNPGLLRVRRARGTGRGVPTRPDNSSGHHTCASGSHGRGSEPIRSRPNSTYCRAISSGEAGPSARHHVGSAVHMVTTARARSWGWSVREPTLAHRVCDLLVHQVVSGTGAPVNPIAVR